jgi:hypothetical protein
VLGCVFVSDFISLTFTHTLFLFLSLSLSFLPNRIRKTSNFSLCKRTSLFLSSCSVLLSIAKVAATFTRTFEAFMLPHLSEDAKKRKQKQKKLSIPAPALTLKASKRFKKKVGRRKERKKATNLESLIWLSFFPPLYAFVSCFNEIVVSLLRALVSHIKA